MNRIWITKILECFKEFFFLNHRNFRIKMSFLLEIKLKGMLFQNLYENILVHRKLKMKWRILLLIVERERERERERE